MYFEIRNSYKNIGRGGFPQSIGIELEKGKTVHDDDFIWNVGDTSFPDFTPNTGTLIIRNGAKLTDFISSATISSGFILSSRVKSILENFTLTPYSFYKCSLSHKDVLIENYFYLHTLNRIEIEVDFTRSIFSVKNFENVTEKLQFSSINELQSRSNELNNTNGKYTLQFESLFIKKFISEELDLFQLSTLGYGTFISSRLKKALEENNITGIDYREAKIYYS